MNWSTSPKIELSMIYHAGVCRQLKGNLKFITFPPDSINSILLLQ